jgi:hypothetical protein
MTVVMRRSLLAASVLALLISATSASNADAARSLTEYRYFRALSVDLAGRLPSRAELAAFEKADFDLEKWIDTQLISKGYADRVRRTYMDLLRLDVGQTFAFRPTATMLRRHTILGPDGKKLYVYYRNGQRRAREATDGQFCFTKSEIGTNFFGNGGTDGPLKNVDATVLAANTVAVKPWWLYRDYKSATPKEKYGTTFTPADASWALAPELLKDGDGLTDTTEVRICKEEASVAETGTVYWTGRKAVVAGTLPPYERVAQLPLDDAYANANKGKTVACDHATAITHTVECGCGVGLERCMPSAGDGTENVAFTLPAGTMLGIERPTSVEKTTQSSWNRQWWAQEAVRYLEWIAREDRDFRELLTGKGTLVNGPLAHFYKHQASATCCGNGWNFGYSKPQGLFDVAKVPAMLPHDSSTWKLVPDRGPSAAGILTMPVFLSKYGTRRGRAHVLYNVFQCRQFIAEDVKLEPSTINDLTKRPGCATCHSTLEPMSAYFARVLESDWTYLPSAFFPTDNATCKNADPKKMSGNCRSFYDPSFTDGAHSFLRGAYASAANADAGPPGLAKSMTESPEFGKCVVNNVASSFLGRALNTDDAAMVSRLESAFVDGGYKMRTLIRTLIHEAAYRSANNLKSDAWRDAEGK